MPGMVLDVLDTVSHEFFHAWNVERIRPRTLEPFNFEEANISGELWLAEGFTQYYGTLIMGRAGLATRRKTRCRPVANRERGRCNGTGRQFRSAVEMSQLAPFTDAARVRRRHQLRDTRSSRYYTYGAGDRAGAGPERCATGRTARSRSTTTCARCGACTASLAGRSRGSSRKPYTLKDARDRLAEVSGDRAFADEFFDKYVEGREALDYAPLLLRAGYVLRKRSPGAAWLGAIAIRSTADGQYHQPARRGARRLSRPASIRAISIVDVDGKAIAARRPAGGAQGTQARRPASRSRSKRRGGATGTATITLKEDPSLEFDRPSSPTGGDADGGAEGVSRRVAGLEGR